MKENSFCYYKNTSCGYFPCHKVANDEDFNCMFCYCPLYALGDKCGGNFNYTKEGIKDCSNCLVPHRRENYQRIMEKMDDILELAKKKEN